MWEKIWGTASFLPHHGNSHRVVNRKRLIIQGLHKVVVRGIGRVFSKYAFSTLSPLITSLRRAWLYEKGVPPSGTAKLTCRVRGAQGVGAVGHTSKMFPDFEKSPCRYRAGLDRKRRSPVSGDRTSAFRLYGVTVGDGVFVAAFVGTGVTRSIGTRISSPG